jgi:hypothetical protein
MNPHLNHHEWDALLMALVKKARSRPFPLHQPCSSVHLPRQPTWTVGDQVLGPTASKQGIVKQHIAFPRQRPCSISI